VEDKPRDSTDGTHESIEAKIDEADPLSGQIRLGGKRYVLTEKGRAEYTKEFGYSPPVSDEEVRRMQLAEIRLYIREYYHYNETVYFDPIGEISEILLDVMLIDFGIRECIARRMDLEAITFLFFCAGSVRRAIANNKWDIIYKFQVLFEEPEQLGHNEIVFALYEMVHRIAQVDLFDNSGMELEKPDESPSSEKSRRPKDQDKRIKCLGHYADAIGRGETPPSATELARRVGCSPGTASRAIQEWEKTRRAHAREDARERYRDKS
jgi:hypothetical protein